MASELILIIDDRAPPPSEVVLVLGQMRFLQIIRRRRRLLDELVGAAEGLSGDPVRVEVISSRNEARDLLHRIENRGKGPLYLRLPSCIMPLKLLRLPELFDKSRYALESMMLSRLFEDDAVTLLTSSDAANILRASTDEDRRLFLLQLAENNPAMIDHLAFVDLRRPKSLLNFLSGSTETRHFNSVTSDGNTLRKASSDVAKMRAEHQLFHLAPEGMKRYLMPTSDYWEADGKAGYSMEHLAVPDVALQFIHEAFDPSSFEMLLNQAFSFLASRATRNASAEVRRAWDEQVVGKLHSRINSFRSMPTGQKLDAVMKTSGPHGGLDQLLAKADAILAAARKRDSSQSLVFSHGDLCFSNILFDRRLGMLRLIDPRGATNAEDAFMHPLYDVAKLSHSVLGGYDFINNDMFHCTLDANLTLELVLGDSTDRNRRTDEGTVSVGPPAWAQEMFRARLKVANFDLFCVRAVELSLFLSMLPLHSDHPRKLAGFVLVAANIISELEGQIS